MMPYPILTAVWLLSSMFIQGPDAIFSTPMERGMFTMCFLMFGTVLGWIWSDNSIGFYAKHLEYLQAVEKKRLAALSDAEKLIEATKPH